MAPIAALAGQVRNGRRPAADDNLFVAMQENVSAQIVAALDAWRDGCEAFAECAFTTTYGSPTLQAAFGIDASATLPLRGAAKSVLHQELIDKRIAELKSRMTSGGLREAVIRGLLFAGVDRAAVDERGFEAVRRIRQTLSDVPLSTFKSVVREQFYMLLLDTEGALAAIPAMLPDDAEARRRAFGLIDEVLRARGEYSSEDSQRIQRIGRLFGAYDRLNTDPQIAGAADLKRLQAKAS